MAANMSVEILNRIYLSSDFRYKVKWIADSNEVKNVEFNYVEINNNKCIISKMAAKMAAENLNLMYLCFKIPTSTHASIATRLVLDEQNQPVTHASHIATRYTIEIVFPQMAPYGDGALYVMIRSW